MISTVGDPHDAGGGDYEGTDTSVGDFADPSELYRT